MLLGDFSNERLDVAPIGRDFGWSVIQTADLDGLREIGLSRTVIGVLVQSGSVGMAWPKVLRSVRTAVPRARIILCHKADQVDARTQMVDAGAFGVLLTPLAHSEVRQSLGFIWASKITPMQQIASPARKLSSKTSSIEEKVRQAGAA